jgi:predicted ATP-dependent protease
VARIKSFYNDRKTPEFYQAMRETMANEVRYTKRLTMMLLQSVKPDINLVDREAVRQLILEAMHQGYSDHELERCEVEVTYRLVPYHEVLYPEAGPHG